jgi:Ca-activated chloride channel family protein
VIEGDLKDRGEARQVYGEALGGRRRAAIMEENRSNVFSIRVANILPGEDITVELTLVDHLTFEDGEAVFRFPLVVAPRFVAGAPLDRRSVGEGIEHDTDQVPDASTISPPVLLPDFPNPAWLSIVVDIHADGVARGDFQSSYQNEMFVSKDPENFRIRVQHTRQINRDFILRYPIPPVAAPRLLFIDQPADDKPVTFALTFTHPSLAVSPKARDIVLVVDCSGSMRGWKLRSATYAASRIVQELHEWDQFTILVMNGQTPIHCWPDRFLCAASRSRRQLALKCLAVLESGGGEGSPVVLGREWGRGTELGQALETAVRVLNGSNRSAEKIVVLVSDGQAAAEDAILLAVAVAAGKSIPRIIAVGIDSAVNTGLLRRLAGLASGSCEFVECEERLIEVMPRIIRKLQGPVLTDVYVEGTGLILVPGSPAVPQPVALYPGETITILGRCLGTSNGPITIRGKDSEGRQQSYIASAHRADSVLAPALPLLLARARVRDLEDQYSISHSPSQRQQLASQIIKTSLEAGVQSRFTAWVAADDKDMMDAEGDLHRAVQAVELPHAWLTDPDFGMPETVEIGASGDSAATDEVTGTPGYMSPDMWSNQLDLCSRSDLYGYAVWLYLQPSGRTDETDPDRDPPRPGGGAGSSSASRKSSSAHSRRERERNPSLQPISDPGVKLFISFSRRDADHVRNIMKQLISRAMSYNSSGKAFSPEFTKFGKTPEEVNAQERVGSMPKQDSPTAGIVVGTDPPVVLNSCGCPLHDFWFRILLALTRPDQSPVRERLKTVPPRRARSRRSRRKRIPLYGWWPLEETILAEVATWGSLLPTLAKTGPGPLWFHNDDDQFWNPGSFGTGGSSWVTHAVGPDESVLGVAENPRVSPEYEFEIILQASGLVDATGFECNTVNPPPVFSNDVFPGIATDFLTVQEEVATQANSVVTIVVTEPFPVITQRPTRFAGADVVCRQEHQVTPGSPDVQNQISLRLVAPDMGVIVPNGQKRPGSRLSAGLDRTDAFSTASSTVHPIRVWKGYTSLDLTVIAAAEFRTGQFSVTVTDLSTPVSETSGTLRRTHELLELSSDPSDDVDSAATAIADRKIEKDGVRLEGAELLAAAVALAGCAQDATLFRAEKHRTTVAPALLALDASDGLIWNTTDGPISTGSGLEMNDSPMHLIGEWSVTGLPPG